MSSVASLGGASAMSSAAKSKSETVNYLLLYEAMVRNQDLEFDATHDHIALTMGRIQHLGRRGDAAGGKGGGGTKNNATTTAPPELVDEAVVAADDDDGPPGMLTYLQMRRCLLRLGYAWNRSILLNSDGRSSQEYCYDDDVSVMSAGSASTFRSGGGAASTANNSSVMAATRDIIATDAQLIMLLTTLVEMEERHRAKRLAEEAEEDDDDEETDEDGRRRRRGDADGLFSRGLYLPEFIQAYKLIIGGMQSLQTYPSPDESGDVLRRACAALGLRSVEALDDLRVRSRERTLGLLALFGPDSTMYGDKAARGETSQSAGEDHTESHSIVKNRKGQQRDGLSNQRSNDKNKSQSQSSRSRSGNKATLKAKDGLSPRFTEEEIRKMVHSKDSSLAKILEDHESEMNVMASNMEHLRQKSISTQSMLKKRRRRTRAAAVVGLVLAACGGGFYEYRKREQVRVEIATGREAERLEDALTIASLEGTVSTLTSKLSDAEATIRYEETRYSDVKKRYEGASKKLKETESRWSIDARELETCRVTRKELDAALTSARTHNDEVEEEVGWCRERLASAERSMEGMQRALKKKTSFEDAAREIEDADAKRGDGDATTTTTSRSSGDGGRGDDDKKKKGKLKPVKMEMKYNKSFRNAVFLRQIYSAVGGMVASLLFPGIGKLFGMMFL
mmetsp:Transcript_33799/g.81705  ORF Transcript_33799/g.81705 Transcript_33799/m.81705 type:complete len:679 (+) Transcript_33799:218-2254(+)